MKGDGLGAGRIKERKRRVKPCPECGGRPYHYLNCQWRSRSPEEQAALMARVREAARGGNGAGAGGGTVTGEQIKGRDVRRGDHIQDPRGSRFLRIDAIVEVPEMNGRTLWFEDCGRGDYRAVGLDEDLICEPQGEERWWTW